MSEIVIISEPDTIERILLQYAADKKLVSDLSITEDGLLVIVDNTTTTSGGGEEENNKIIKKLVATIKLKAEWDGKVCEYSAGSIYLQIIDPNQGLLVYRNACKQYNVNDPVKALDKKIVVSYFLGNDGTTEPQQQQQQTQDTAVTTATTAVTTTISDTAEPKTKTTTATIIQKESNKESKKDDEKKVRDKDHDRKDKDRRDNSSSGKHRDDHRRQQQQESSADRQKRKEREKQQHQQHQSNKESSSPQKKPKKDIQLVTNEQLMDNLDFVVDKRKIDITTTEEEEDGQVDVEEKKQEDEEQLLMKKQQEEIRKALSAEGFLLYTGGGDTKSGENTSNNRTVITDEHKKRTADILANEIPVGNSASILRANNPRKDLSRVLELYLETINPGKDNNKKGQLTNKGLSSNSSNTNKGGSNTLQRKPYLVGKKPVIVVPKGMTAPLTIINAYEFFCNAKFVPRDVMLKQQQAGQPKSVPPSSFKRNVAQSGVSSTQASASTSSNMLEYEITDNPRKLLGPDPKEWERIVAVIVLGQSWQFKDWHKTYSTPATLFNNVYGFFIAMEGDKEPAEVTGWSVTRSYLNRDKRGLDRVTFASFWNRLDEWMRVYKPELLPVSNQD